MRKTLYLLALILLFWGCKKEEAVTLEENGLTVDINSLVPQSTIDKMEQLGLVIYSGTTPPAVNGIFKISPFLLQATTITNDYAIGYQFADLKVKFYEQNNKKLTLKADYVAGPEEGTGIGSFIVGSADKFTIFVKITATNSGTTSTSVQVISGSVEGGALKNIHTGYFMVDNNGRTDIWMGNGEGRLFYDSDGTSEAITALKSAQLMTGKSACSSAPLK